MTKADKCAKEADTAAFSRLNWTTMLIVASAYAVIAFLCNYLAQGAMQALVKAMPAWLTHGLRSGWRYSACRWFWLAAARNVQSAIYPLPDRRFPVCLLIQVSNPLPVAVLGAGFAVYEFFNAKSRQQAQPQPVASKNEEEDYSNGI